MLLEKFQTARMPTFLITAKSSSVRGAPVPRTVAWAVSSADAVVRRPLRSYFFDQMNIPLSRALARGAARPSPRPPSDGDADTLPARVKRWLAAPATRPHDASLAATTVGEALCWGAERAMDELGCDYDAASAVLACASRAVAPRARLVRDMVRASEASSLATGMPTLDALLRGGVARGHVTELVGQPGAGKTQLCLTLSARAARRGDGVVYVDAEGKFSASRLVGVLRALGGEERDAERVRVVRGESFSCEQLLARVQELEEDMLRHACSLLVVDGVAAVARAQFGRDGLVERQQALSRLASRLKFAAETLDVAVVVTNQVVGGPSAGDAAASLSRIATSSRDLGAALGNTWAHAVNVRIALEVLSSDLDDATRPRDARARVVKSPVSGEGSCAYVVGPCGVEEVGVP